MERYGNLVASAANNIIERETPRIPVGNPLAARAANEARMRGKPQKRMKQKKKPLGTFAAGTPTITPKEFYKAMPRPAGAMGYPARPTQLDMREARAHAATMAINDGLDASMPLDQRKC